MPLFITNSADHNEILLSWHVQNVIAISSRAFKYWSKLEFGRNTISGIGAWKAKIYLSCRVSIMTAHDMVMPGAKAPPAMTLIKISGIILVLATEELNVLSSKKKWVCMLCSQYHAVTNTSIYNLVM